MNTSQYQIIRTAINAPRYEQKDTIFFHPTANQRTTAAITTDYAEAIVTGIVDYLGNENYYFIDYKNEVRTYHFIVEENQITSKKEVEEIKC